MVQVRCLNPLFSFGIRIIQDPFLARQVAQMSSIIQHSLSDLLQLALRFIFHQKITPGGAVRSRFGLCQNMIGIAPDKVRNKTIIHNHSYIAAIQVCRHQPGKSFAVRVLPAMQCDKAGAIRTEQ
ncbi:hypothetical protein PM8797T_21253 [Gimesia maris DSM 8797]|nr:hypothetical protein PM8797T_21253 [Gimesia maris DSM 8797]